MGEELTADMLLAIQEVTELKNAATTPELIAAADYVINAVQMELMKRPTYDSKRVQEICGQVFEAFGKHGYLTRAIIYVSLLKMVYSRQNQDLQYEAHFAAVINALMESREKINGNGVSRK